MKGWRSWLWVPSLYFAESLPNAVVGEVAPVLYTDLGLTTIQLGVITGWMYLAWVVKPLWSPLVELVKTKRWWIVTTQLLLGACFLGLAVSIRLPVSWLFWSAACLWLMAFISATHDIAADGFYMLGLDERHQAGFNGVRSTAYRMGSLFGKGLLVYIAGRLLQSMGGAVPGWSTVFYFPAGFYVLCATYHFFVLPKPSTDVAAPSTNFLHGYGESFRTFFAKPGILSAIAFMLLFRLAEVQVVVMAAPFLKGKPEAGGLGLTTQDYGIAYGTYGVLGLICGGLLAGFLVARYGLRRWYWPLIVTMHVPNAAFIYLAYMKPTSLAIISACLFVEQFGYGFGFTAYTLFLLYYSKGDRQTAHYAIGTGFMAMSAMLPRFISGYVQTALGFQGFFLYILACTVPSFLVAWIAWQNKAFIETFPPAEREG